MKFALILLRLAQPTFRLISQQLHRSRLRRLWIASASLLTSSVNPRSIYMSSSITTEPVVGKNADHPADLEKVSFPVTGMTCAACQSFIQRTLKAEAGVQDATVNLMLHNATVTFDPRVTS